MQRVIAGLLLLAAGCQQTPDKLMSNDKPEPAVEQPAPAQPEPPETTVVSTLLPPLQLPEVTGPALPDNLELGSEEGFFKLDTTTAEISLPVQGDATFKLSGRLRSADGRREIVATSRHGTERIFAADWWMPGAGAVAETGDVLVCANRLVGKQTTRLTAGSMPDPRFGVDLVCRLRTSDGWQPEQILARQDGASWFINLVPRRGGAFWVIFSTDHSGLLLSDPEPGDAIRRVEFANGKFGDTTIAYEFKLPPKRQ
jgi:hypothetical protein